MITSSHIRHRSKQLCFWLNEYAQGYYTGNSHIDANIDLKLFHSLRVADIAREIAQQLHLNPYEEELAYCCGLVHDAGRFKQYALYRSFVDTNEVYHGDLGVEVLRETNVLSSFSKEETQIIIKAVRNHGLLQIDHGVDDKTLLYCNITRDADKTDIYQIVSDYYHRSGERNQELELGLSSAPHISAAVFDNFRKGKVIKKTDMQTIDDFKILQLSWIFDINFRCTLTSIIEKQYLTSIINSIEDEGVQSEILGIMNHYLKNMESHESI